MQKLKTNCNTSWKQPTYKLAKYLCKHFREDIGPRDMAQIEYLYCMHVKKLSDYRKKSEAWEVLPNFTNNQTGEN